jgi:hypothetical protein
MIAIRDGAIGLSGQAGLDMGALAFLLDVSREPDGEEEPVVRALVGMRVSIEALLWAAPRIGE